MSLEGKQEKKQEEQDEDYLSLKEDFEDLYQNAPCGYLSHLKDGLIARINDTALNWLGYTREQVIMKMKITDLFDIGGKIFYQTHHLPLLTMQGHVKELNYNLISKSGSVRPVLISATTQKDSNDKFTLARATIFDISDRKKYETQLLKAKDKAEEAEKRFRFMAEAVPALIWTMDSDGELDYYSRKFYDCTGKDFGDEKVTRKDWVALLYPRDRQKTLNALDHALSNGVEYKVEHRIQNKNGGYTWMQSWAIPFKDESGLIFKWFGTTVDIDEDKKAKDAINKAQNHLKLVINTIPAIVAYIDSDRKYVLANDIYLEWLEKKKSSVIGHTAEEVFGVKVYQQLRPYIERALKGEKVTFEHLFSNQKGEQRFLKVSYNPDRQGKKINGFVLFASDITEQRKFEDVLEQKVQLRTIELARVNKELLRSNADLEQFAFISSHDLKEPLRMIAIYSQLLIKKVQNESDEIKEFGEYLGEGVLRMKNLIDDLLEYARIGKGDLVFQPVDTNIVMNEVRDNLSWTVMQKKGEIITGNLPVINSSKSLLVHLFQNLVSNALKFSKEDSQPVIHISSERQGEAWLFCVADNGIGIDPAYSSKIFNIFQRLHTRDKYPGTGIGLALCQKIVDLHHGRIWYEPNKAGGTTFKFLIPLE